jgi:hypothetical protein
MKFPNISRALFGNKNAVGPHKRGIIGGVLNSASKKIDSLARHNQNKINAVKNAPASLAKHNQNKINAVKKAPAAAANKVAKNASIAAIELDKAGFKGASKVASKVARKAGKVSASRTKLSGANARSVLANRAASGLSKDLNAIRSSKPYQDFNKLGYKVADIASSSAASLKNDVASYIDKKRQSLTSSSSDTTSKTSSDRRARNRYLKNEKAKSKSWE